MLFLLRSSSSRLVRADRSGISLILFSLRLRLIKLLRPAKGEISLMLLPQRLSVSRLVRPDRAEIRNLWNEEYPKYKYTDLGVTNFARDAKYARDRVLGWANKGGTR